MTETLSPQEVSRAVDRTSRLSRLKRLQPAGSSYVQRFGSHAYDPLRPERGGLEGNLKGKWEYHFPRGSSPEAQRRINEAILEMQEPWRRASTAHCSERNASIPSARLKTAGGLERVVPEHQAEQIGRSRGLLPVWRAGGSPLLEDEEGYLYHADGTPTGHTHLGEPWDHQRKSCRGCQVKP